MRKHECDCRFLEEITFSGSVECWPVAYRLSSNVYNRILTLGVVESQSDIHKKRSRVHRSRIVIRWTTISDWSQSLRGDQAKLKIAVHSSPPPDF